MVWGRDGGRAGSPDSKGRGDSPGAGGGGAVSRDCHVPRRGQNSSSALVLQFLVDVHLLHQLVSLICTVFRSLCMRLHLHSCLCPGDWAGGTCSVTPEPGEDTGCCRRASRPPNSSAKRRQLPPEQDKGRMVPGPEVGVLLPFCGPLSGGGAWRPEAAQSLGLVLWVCAQPWVGRGS